MTRKTSSKSDDVTKLKLRKTCGKRRQRRRVRLCVRTPSLSEPICRSNTRKLYRSSKPKSMSPAELKKSWCVKMRHRCERRGVGFTKVGEKTKWCLVFVSDKPMEAPTMTNSNSLLIGAWPACTSTPRVDACRARTEAMVARVEHGGARSNYEQSAQRIG